MSDEKRTSTPMPRRPALPPLAHCSREELIDMVHRLNNEAEVLMQLLARADKLLQKLEGRGNG